MLNVGDNGWKWETPGCRKSLIWMVGATGFEPATSCSQGRHSSQAEPRPDIVKFAEYVDYVFIQTKLKYTTGKGFSRKKE